MVSQIVPSASRLVGQILSCLASGNASHIQFVLNDAVLPMTGIKGCKDNKNGLYDLVSSIQERIGEVDFTFDCFANYTFPIRITSLMTWECRLKRNVPLYIFYSPFPWLYNIPLPPIVMDKAIDLRCKCGHFRVYSPLVYRSLSIIDFWIFCAREDFSASQMPGPCNTWVGESNNVWPLYCQYR